MKKIIFTLFLLLSSLYAEMSPYSLISHRDFNSALVAITEDYDRTITAVGFSKEYKHNSNQSSTYSDAFEYLASQSNKFGSQMHIMKVDTKAKVLLSKFAHLAKFNRAIAVVKSATNGYFIGGYTLDGSLLVTKMDANANILFFKLFGTKNYDRMSNLVLMSDGGVLAVGSSTTSRETSDNMFNSGLGNNDIFITRFDKNGKQLWSKKYGTEYDDVGIDAVEAQDGSILVLSSTSHTKKRDVNFMRLTENGNKIWLKHYIKDVNEDKLVTPKKIIRLKDNNFIAVLSQYNEMQKEHIRIVKFDLYQNILIDKEIFTTYPSAINDIKEYSDGRFIAVGYIKDTFNTDGLAMILDSNLNLLTQEHYGAENYDVFNAVAILHNSQAAVAGLHTDNTSQETNMWIVKLNQDAKMALIKQDKQDIYTALRKLFEKEIANSLVQIKKDLTIELLDTNMLFSVGEYKLNKEQQKFLNAFCKKLIPFLYKQRENIAALSINGHASSEWKGVDFENSYLNNSKLSFKRAYSVLSYIFQGQSKSEQEWLSKIILGSAYSFSKKVAFHSIENRIKSRRVSFKIGLK